MNKQRIWAQLGKSAASFLFIALGWVCFRHDAPPIEGWGGWLVVVVGILCFHIASTITRPEEKR